MCKCRIISLGKGFPWSYICSRDFHFKDLAISSFWYAWDSNMKTSMKNLGGDYCLPLAGFWIHYYAEYSIHYYRKHFCNAIFTAGSSKTTCWNDEVFNRAQAFSFLQVVFRGTHWTHFLALLQNEEERPFIQWGYHVLETMVMELFASFGWQFSNGLSFSW